MRSRARTRTSSDSLWIIPEVGFHSECSLDGRGGAYAPLPVTEQATEARGEGGRRGGGDSSCLKSVPLQVALALTIFANAVVIGLETDNPELRIWNVVEVVFLVIFSLELLLRWVVLGPRGFFDPSGSDFVWNLFDFVVVSLGVLDTACLFFAPSLEASGNDGESIFRLMRMLRILRIFKIVRFLRQLYMLAMGFLEAARAVLWVTVLMFFALYICAVVLVRTVGSLPEPGEARILVEQFGTIPTAMLSLFQIMAVPDIREYLVVFPKFPLFCLFLLGFVIFGAFGMIALLTGVISESMFEKNHLRNEEELKEKEAKRRIMRQCCKDLLKQVGHTTHASKQELVPLLKEVTKLFESHLIQWSQQDLDKLLDVIDVDSAGTINKEELCNSILTLAEGVRPMAIVEVYYVLCRQSRKLDRCEAMLSKVLTVVDAAEKSSKKQHESYTDSLQQVARRQEETSWQSRLAVLASASLLQQPGKGRLDRPGAVQSFRVEGAASWHAAPAGGLSSAVHEIDRLLAQTMEALLPLKEGGPEEQQPQPQHAEGGGGVGRQERQADPQQDTHSNKLGSARSSTASSCVRGSHSGRVPSSGTVGAEVRGILISRLDRVRELLRAPVDAGVRQLERELAEVAEVRATLGKAMASISAEPLRGELPEC